MSDSSDKTLIILRGVSGSGKSTLAKSLIDGKTNYTICSSDDYFVDPKTGSYVFHPVKLGRAHHWNQKRAERAMRYGVELVIIDNTHTERWEAKPYVECAKKHNYSVQVKEPQTEWKFDAVALSQKNQHGVPLKSIEQMLKRYQTDYSVDSILRSQIPRGRGGSPSLPSMIQVMLKKESAQLLENRASMRFNNQQGQHVTIAFQPDEEIFNKLIASQDVLEKDTVKVRTSRLVWSDSFGVQTVRVSSLECDRLGKTVELDTVNKHAHITVSVDRAKGRNPVDSNQLLEMHENEEDHVESEELELDLDGQVHFVYFGKRRQKRPRGGHNNRRGGPGRKRGKH